jgi:alkaline phosphatase D
MVRVLAAAAAGQFGGCGAAGGGESGESGSEGSSTGGGTGDTGEPTTGEPTTGEPTPQLPGEPFTLGIASGDPLPDSVILWTRLAPAPEAADGGMPAEVFSVRWEVASDEAFSDIVASDVADAEPRFAHSLHVDVRGLEPDTWYWYRFKIGEYTSAVGRTRTTPALDSKPERLSFATASCQSYVDGYFTAYQHMAQEDLDMVVFLGDYIYESGETGPIRSHVNPEPTTLDEYRVRHALYKGDKDLQAMHLRCPWLFIWDDHEVENDYAGDISQDNAPLAEWLARRAAAYQAYYEHMPLRLPPPEGPDYKMYHALQWGDLAEFWLLDTRQYRSDQNCNDEPGAGCDGWQQYDGTLLGDEQEGWLMNGLTTSAAIWKLVTQQIVFSTVDFHGSLINFDQWDGYPKARQRLLDFIATEELENVVVLSGDIHLGGLGELSALAYDDESPVVATEIVTTSLTSAPNVPPEALEAALGDLPLIKYINAHARGYVSHLLTRGVYTVRCFVVDTALEPTSGGVVEAERFIDAGVPGFRPVP